MLQLRPESQVIRGATRGRRGIDCPGRLHSGFARRLTDSSRFTDSGPLSLGSPNCDADAGSGDHDGGSGPFGERSTVVERTAVERPS